MLHHIHFILPKVSRMLHLSTRPPPANPSIISPSHKGISVLHHRHARPNKNIIVAQFTYSVFPCLPNCPAPTPSHQRDKGNIYAGFQARKYQGTHTHYFVVAMRRVSDIYYTTRVACGTNNRKEESKIEWTKKRRLELAPWHKRNRDTHPWGNASSPRLGLSHW